VIEMTQREKILEGEVRRWPKPLQVVYQRLREKGNSIPLAHMLASRRGPFMKNSNDTFNASQHASMTREMTEEHRDSIVAIAQKAGISTHGKTYFGQLGTYDDPMAWVSNADDCIAKLKHKGADADGLLHVRGKRKDKEPPKTVRLAPKLVKEMMRRELTVDPKLREKYQKGKIKKSALKERVIEKYGQPADR